MRINRAIWQELRELLQESYPIDCAMMATIIVGSLSIGRDSIAAYLNTLQMSHTLAREVWDILD